MRTNRRITETRRNMPVRNTESSSTTLDIFMEALEALLDMCDDCAAEEEISSGESNNYFNQVAKPQLGKIRDGAVKLLYPGKPISHSSGSEDGRGWQHSKWDDGYKYR